MGKPTVLTEEQKEKARAYGREYDRRKRAERKAFLKKPLTFQEKLRLYKHAPKTAPIKVGAFEDLVEVAPVYELVDVPPAPEDELVEDVHPDELSPRERQRHIFRTLTMPRLEVVAKGMKQLSPDDQQVAMKLFEAAEKTGCELSLATFYKCVWPYLDPAPYKHNWHIDATAEQAEKLITGETRRLIVNQPPRTGKSNLLSVVLPLWIWIQPERGPMSGPQVKFLCASYGQSLSMKHSGDMRKIIQSAWFQRNWGHRFKLLDDRNAVGMFENSAGGYRMATSVGAGLTGQGGDCVAEGTKVSTPDGVRNVEDIKVGDDVFGFDISRGKVVIEKVLATRTLVHTEFYDIHTAAGHTLRCTGNHPVFVPGVGYIAANKLGVGDRLLVQEGARNRAPSRLRLLWQRASRNALHAAQEFTTRRGSDVLPQEMPCGAPRNQERETMRGVRGDQVQSRLSLLFPGLRFGGSAQKRGGEARAEDLSVLSETFLEANDLLFEGVRQQSAFATDVGGFELEVQGAREILEPVSQDGSLYQDQGRPRLRSMRVKGQEAFSDNASQQTPLSKIGFARTPYRREHAQQHSDEFDHAVRSMPQDAPSWSADRITAITRHSGEPNRFYDIQVARVCNFFAEGVLVHNCIIIDDPANTQDVTSAAERASVVNWYTQSLSTRLNDPKTGVMLLVMQRQHEEDLTGHILNTEPEMWEHFVLRMRYEGNPYLAYDPRSNEGDLLWADRIPEDEVQKLEKTLGTYGASGQLQQRPEPKGGGLIKVTDWQMFPPAGSEEEWKRDGVICWPPFEFVVASCDLAFTEKQENDFSALTMWGLWHDRTGAPKLVAMYAWQDRLSFNPLITRIGNNCRKFKPDVLLIEAKAAGISAAQEIQRVYGAAEWSTVLVNPKGDKVSRAISVQGLFEEGLIFAPDRAWAQLLIDTCASFPKGAHDDLVDSATQALRWMRDNGIIKRKEEYKSALFAAMPRSGEVNAELSPYDV